MNWLRRLFARQLRALCAHCGERLPLLLASDLGEHEIRCPACLCQTTVEISRTDGRATLSTWPTEDGRPGEPKPETAEQARARQVLGKLLEQTRAGKLRWVGVSSHDPRWAWRGFEPEFRAVWESRDGDRWALYIGYHCRLLGDRYRWMYKAPTGKPEFWLAKIVGEMENECQLATDCPELRDLLQEADERLGEWLQEAIDAILAMSKEDKDKDEKEKVR